MCHFIVDYDSLRLLVNFHPNVAFALLLSAVVMICCPSSVVCLLSVIQGYCDETTEAIITQFSLNSSNKIKQNIYFIAPHV